MTTQGLAVVTGASTGIGFELARICALNGFDLMVAADEPEIDRAARELSATGVSVTAVQADLARPEGVAELYRATQAAGQPVTALLANAGRGLGGSFLDQDIEEALHVLDTNVTGTLRLAHLIGRDMRDRGDGRILFTGSIAGFIPGSFQAVYNGTKAFVDSFSYALRNELADSGVTVTVLMPGPTETEFFERAGLEDTRIGQGKKADPADVARTGFDAMMKGEAGVVHGLKNKAQAALSGLAPKTALAEEHRRETKPKSPAR